MEREFLTAVLDGLMRVSIGLAAPVGVVQDGAGGDRPAVAAAAPSADAEGRARALFELLAAAKHDAFVAAGDEGFRKALTGPKLAASWAPIAFQLGAFREIETAKSTAVGAHQSVRIAAKFERGRLVTRLVLNSQGELSGWWVDAVQPSKGDYTPPKYVKPDAFTESEVEFECDGLKLPGTLSLPRGDGPHPAVVLVHGSGPHDRDEQVGPNRPFRDLALGLASQGVAVLRYEKRTKAHPTFLPPKDWTLEAEVISDAIAAANLLRSRPEIDGRRIVVVGHSLGGMLAPVIAERDGQLAGIVIVAGSPRSLLDILEDQFKWLTKVAGESEEQKKQLDELLAQIAEAREGKFGPDATIAGMPVAYFQKVDALDVGGAARRLKTPILIIHAGRDYQITQKDLKAWQGILPPDGANSGHVTYKVYDELNHLLITGSGPSSPAEYQQAGHVDERVVRDIAAWVRKR